MQQYTQIGNNFEDGNWQEKEVIIQKEQKERVIPYLPGMSFNSYLTVLQSSTNEQLFEEKEEDKNLGLKCKKNY